MLRLAYGKQNLCSTNITSWLLVFQYREIELCSETQEEGSKLSYEEQS